ncbi:MAG: zinc ABC transporter substrate-binding protein [Desulfococcaceae bacterium]|jgi:zinc transport system substrate-binding protein|nr:zinc ABC transporter substrate-binding protein [Desulfococcaceae bacterium]
MKTVCKTVGLFFLLFPSLLMADESLSVFVSVIPQKYFVEKIGGDQVKVSVMVEPGAGPAVYEPKPVQMTELSKARIYFSIGVPFENTWLQRFKAANPDMRIIPTQEGIEKIAMAAHHHEEEKEGAYAHAHEGIKDPHIWLSPPLVMIQARNILTGLLGIDPENSDIYEKNYKSFIREIAELDTEILGILGREKKRSEFMVFHPAWGYFARAYGLKQFPAEVEGKEPKPAELQKLIQWGKKEKIRAVFVQPQYSAKSARVLASAIGGQVIAADPLAPDWPENLRQTAVKFRNALQQ